jgi:hypothetical protein
LAVAHDATSESHTGTTPSLSEASFNWTHTPSGTPTGLLIFTFDFTSNTHAPQSIDYGGTNVPAVSGGVATDSAAEPASVKAWFLTAPPSGSQTVTVTRTNNANGCYAVAITVTGTTPEVYEPGIVLLNDDGALAEQNVDDNSPGTNSVRYAGCYSGDLNVPTTGANSTLLHDIDLGPRGGKVVRETTAGQGSRPVGCTSPSDDRAAVHLAVREGGGGPQTVTVGLLDQSGVLFAPKANFTIFTGLLDQAGVLFAPKVNEGVTVPLLSQAGVLFAPSVGFRFSPGAIDQSGVLFTPKANFRIIFPLIDQAGTLFAPVITISGGPQTVSPGLLSQAGTLFAPQVNFKIAIPLLSQAGVPIAPKMNFRVTFPLISQAGTLFAPTVATLAQTVSPGLISQAGVLFAPTIIIVAGPEPLILGHQGPKAGGIYAGSTGIQSAEGPRAGGMASGDPVVMGRHET